MMPHLIAVLCLLLTTSGLISVDHQQAFGQTSGSVTMGGLGRYNSNHWGLVKGTFGNRSDQPERVTAIVTPHRMSGARFVRSVTVPPDTIREASWPVLLDRVSDDAFEFDVIILDGNYDSAAIKQSRFGETTDSFTSGNSGGRYRQEVRGTYSPGVSAVCYSRAIPDDLTAMSNIDRFAIVARQTAGMPPMIIPFTANDLNGYAEALDPAQQLLISAPDLVRHPDACEAMRLWVQRGGRALLFLTECGEQTAQAVLGESVPVTFVEQTTVNQVDFLHNPDFRRTGAADRSFQREFDEPVHFVRAEFERGQDLWTIDGWPALVQIPFGDGHFFACMVSANALLDDQGKPNAFADPVMEVMYRTEHEQPLLADAALAESGTQSIGYVIPERTTAATVLIGFTALLMLIGFFLWKKDRPIALLIAVPVLALAAAAPGILLGKQSRNVAPATVLERRIANLGGAQATFAADGTSTIFVPDATSGQLDLQPHANLRAPDTEGSQSPRFVWLDHGESFWSDFSQPAGATSYSQQSVLRLSQPLSAAISFDKEGAVLDLPNSEQLQPEDLVLAGSGPDRMSVQSVDGNFRSRPQDVLAADQFSNAALLSDRQLSRAEQYRQLFSSERLLGSFPAQPTLLFWTDQLDASLSLPEAERTESATMIAIPVDLRIPPAGQDITIPPVFLPYRVERDIDGSVGGSYSTGMRKWIRKKTGSTIVLRFTLPEAVQPMEFTGAELMLRVFAGSRTVRLQMGPLDQMQDITTLESPVGNQNMSIDPSILNSFGDGRNLLLRISISDLEGVDPENRMNAEQDDFWQIERLLLTVHGARNPAIDR